MAELPALITSSECTPAGEGHNYDKLFPHKVKVGISGLFIQATFGESESLFCPVTKTDISLLSQLLLAVHRHACTMTVRLLYKGACYKLNGVRR